MEKIVIVSDYFVIFAKDRNLVKGIFRYELNGCNK